jgi:putative ABC transport system substrate-binding protein
VGVILGVQFSAKAQPGQKTWRIGFFSASAPPPDGALPASLRNALAALGYVEGVNVNYFARWGDARKEQLPLLAAELAGLKLDAVVAMGSGITAAALMAVTSSVPIIFAGAGDPVGVGLVASLSRPGGNLTGISAQATELSAKRLEFLQEMVPKAARVAVLYNADDPAMSLRFKEVDRVAHVLGLTIEPLGVREPDDFAWAFEKMTQDRPDALMMVTDSLTILNRKRMLEFAAAHRIPDIYEYGFLVHEGGLMSYGPDLDEILIRAAFYVDRIFKGAKPSDLPVEQPTKYHLLINIKRAQTLSLIVPQLLLVQADEILQ